MPSKQASFLKVVPVLTRHLATIMSLSLGTDKFLSCGTDPLIVILFFRPTQHRNRDLARDRTISNGGGRGPLGGLGPLSTFVCNAILSKQIASGSIYQPTPLFSFPFLFPASFFSAY
jgi:hypothetical protein